MNISRGMDREGPGEVLGTAGAEWGRVFMKNIVDVYREREGAPPLPRDD
jgi:hypothetical protein